jgi:hypothetical protein
VEEKGLTLKEAAEYLAYRTGKFSPHSLRFFVKGGLVPYHRRPGKGKRLGAIWFLESELSDWLESAGKK